MCTVLLPPRINPIAVNKYIISYIISLFQVSRRTDKIPGHDNLCYCILNNRIHVTRLKHQLGRYIVLSKMAKFGMKIRQTNNSNLILYQTMFAANDTFKILRTVSIILRPFRLVQVHVHSFSMLALGAWRGEGGASINM
jgi:hypothetical protein